MGLTMQLYDHGKAISRKKACCAGQDIYDARQVADRLGFPHYVLDYESRFKESVMEDFADSYLRGETPVPCIKCNQEVKFKDLLATARELGGEVLATGHYVRWHQGEQGPELYRAIDSSRDQSYFLFNTTSEQLTCLRFPLGGMSKTETRHHARRFGLEVASKPDSQDICFVPDGDYGKFLEEYTGKTYAQGNFLDISGKVAGQHRGAVRYTIGQRKKLGLALGKPVYVCEKDMAANTVMVGDEASLMSKGLVVTEVNWLAGRAPTTAIEVQARTRYKQQEQKAIVYPLGDKSLRLEFAQQQRAVAPGQAVVLYQGDVVVAGGTITQVLR